MTIDACALCIVNQRCWTPLRLLAVVFQFLTVMVTLLLLDK